MMGAYSKMVLRAAPSPCPLPEPLLFSRSNRCQVLDDPSAAGGGVAARGLRSAGAGPGAAEGRQDAAERLPNLQKHLAAFLVAILNSTPSMPVYAHPPRLLVS